MATRSIIEAGNKSNGHRAAIRIAARDFRAVEEGAGIEAIGESADDGELTIHNAEPEIFATMSPTSRTVDLEICSAPKDSTMPEALARSTSNCFTEVEAGAEWGSPGVAVSEGWRVVGLAGRTRTGRAGAVNLFPSVVKTIATGCRGIGSDGLPCRDWRKARAL